MRFWFSGPRFLGISPRVSFGRAASDRSGPPRDSVYVIAGSHGLVKIGVSSNPVARLATLQTGSPHRLTLAFSMPIRGDAYAVEQEAHTMLDRHRHSGEWFAVPADVAVAAISGAAYRVADSSKDGEANGAGPLRWGIRFCVLTTIFAFGFRQATPVIFCAEMFAVMIYFSVYATITQFRDLYFTNICKWAAISALSAFIGAMIGVAGR